MTEQERKEKIEALLRERAGYVARGMPNSVAAVDRVLAELGNKGSAPAARGARRVFKAPAHR